MIKSEYCSDFKNIIMSSIWTLLNRPPFTLPIRQSQSPGRIRSSRSRVRNPTAPNLISDMSSYHRLIHRSPGRHIPDLQPHRS